MGLHYHNTDSKQATGHLTQPIHHHHRAAALRVNRERVQMERQMKPHLVTGARLVSTVPTSPDQMKFQHDRATADGMWYTISKEAGVAGHPIGGGRWPKQGAVLVPFEVHEVFRVFSLILFFSLGTSVVFYPLASLLTHFSYIWGNGANPIILRLRGTYCEKDIFLPFFSCFF